jgi:predicted ferric reductase
MPSRARAFTAPFGIDVLLRFHRQLGAVALILVIAHVAVLIADDSSRFSLLDLVHAPFRGKAGVISILALLALTATSLWPGRCGCPTTPGGRCTCSSGSPWSASRSRT